MATKKMMHPAYPRMVCETLHALDETDKMGAHSLVAIKHYMASHYELAAGWEKRLNNTVKMMLHKKQLAHAAGHNGSFRLAKAMAVKEEKRLHRAMAHAQKVAEKEAALQKAPKVKRAAKKAVAKKATGPAKRAKKAAPKKA